MFNDLEKPSTLTSIADEEWNRTSRSWKELQPRVNFDEPLHSSNETVKEYHTRISQILEIPFEVVSEWLFIHYGNTQTVNNYGWIDYRKVDISVRAFSTEELLDLNVI